MKTMTLKAFQSCMRIKILESVCQRKEEQNGFQDHTQIPFSFQQQAQDFLFTHLVHYKQAPVQQAPRATGRRPWFCPYSDNSVEFQNGQVDRNKYRRQNVMDVQGWFQTQAKLLENDQQSLPEKLLGGPCGCCHYKVLQGGQY